MDEEYFGYPRPMNELELLGSAIDKLKSPVDTISDFAPLVGDIKSGGLAIDDFINGDYGSAALNALGVLPFLPGLGTMRNAIKRDKVLETLIAPIIQAEIKAKHDTLRSLQTRVGSDGWNALDKKGLLPFEYADNVETLLDKNRDADLFEGIAAKLANLNSERQVIQNLSSTELAERAQKLSNAWELFSDPGPISKSDATQMQIKDIRPLLDNTGINYNDLQELPGTENLGIRWDGRFFRPGHILPSSLQTYQHHPEWGSEMLNGTSAVDLDFVKNMTDPDLGYKQPWVYLIGGPKATLGDDPGEVVINSAKVIRRLVGPK